MGESVIPHAARPAQLVLFSGPPGVGKSTLSYALARHTGWGVVAKDGIDRTCQRLALPPWPPVTAYQIMLDMADLNLRNGASLILDAVFPKEGFRQQAQECAARHAALFRAIVCRCSDGVVWRQRVEKRPEMIAGWTPADWDEVRRVTAYYEAWSSPHLLLDAVDPLEHNMATMLRYVRG